MSCYFATSYNSNNKQIKTYSFHAIKRFTMVSLPNLFSYKCHIHITPNSTQIAYIQDVAIFTDHGEMLVQGTLHSHEIM